MMRKFILGLLSVLFFGQILVAQPVSDMAVIPMGITIQSVMRLTITKGGNIEFVFNSANDMANGVPTSFGSNYETKGVVSSSRNWDLDLRVEEDAFKGEDQAHDLDLNVVEYKISELPANTVSSAAGTNDEGVLSQLIENFLHPDGPNNNMGSNLGFTIQWRCGVTNKIPGSAVSQRYAANIILTLTAAN